MEEYLTVLALGLRVEEVEIAYLLRETRGIPAGRWCVGHRVPRRRVLRIEEGVKLESHVVVGNSG